MTRPVKINHMGLKKSLILLSFLYHNLIIIYTNELKGFLLMQMLMGFILQLTETVYYNHN